MLTLEQARTERLVAECRRRMAVVARMDDCQHDGRRAKDAAIADIDRILDQLALAMPDEL